MHDSFLRRAHDQWFCVTQSGSRGAVVSRSNCFFDFADIGAHLATPRAVNRGAPLDFTDGLLGRGGVRHQKISWAWAKAKTAIHDGKPAKHGRLSMIPKPKPGSRYIMQRQKVHAATDIPYRSAGEDHANNHEPFGPSTLDIRGWATTSLSCWRYDTTDGRPRLGRGLCD